MKAGKWAREQRGLLSLPELHTIRTTDMHAAGSTDVYRGFANEYTSYASMLENFIDTNTHKKPKLSRSAFINPAPSSDNHTIRANVNEVSTPMPPPPPRPMPAPAPEIILPTIPPRVIVSFAVAKPMIQTLEKLIPGLELTERNYDKHRPTGWFSGLRPPNTDDADIILSPGTGLLMTTMAKLRQKALPGKTKESLFRHVVGNVAVRYERLIVLVSEGNKHSETMTMLFQSDAKALAEFQGSVVSLHTGVQVFYVGGGNDTLARWITAAICRHAPEALPVQNLLLHTETAWEHFLRRVGMNVYAAQVTLGILKVPDEEPAVGGNGLYGLPLFVMMQPESRVSALKSALGGWRALGRVSE